MKKILCSLIAAILLLSAFSEISMKKVLAEVDGPEVYGAAYCVMNADTGDVILSKNQNEKMYPASITKVMTALIVIEECEDLEDVITFSNTALQISSISSTLQPRAREGERMTVKDALYGLMLTSANECGNALAEYNAGSIQAFVGKMNERAQQLGAVNTHFMNTHGLHDENHYTTAYDMALIFQEAIKNETFTEISGTGNYYIPKTNKEDTRFCESGHRMVLGTMPCEGVFCGKSGRTNEAGRTLLTAAKRDGVTVITSLLKSNENNFYNDTQILMEYGYGILDGKYEPVAWTPVNDKVWATMDVKIRQYPSGYAQQAGVLEAGQSIQRVAVYGNWSRVRFGQAECYIDSEYLLNDKDQADAIRASYEADKLAAEQSTEEMAVETTVSQEAGQTKYGGIFAVLQERFGEDWGSVLVLGSSIIVVLVAILVILLKKSSDKEGHSDK